MLFFPILVAFLTYECIPISENKKIIKYYHTIPQSTIQRKKKEYNATTSTKPSSSSSHRNHQFLLPPLALNKHKIHISRRNPIYGIHTPRDIIESYL